jgi:hypothetical protein
MKTLIFWVLMVTAANAAQLEWDNTADGLLDVEFRVTVNEPWIVLKTIPAYPASLPITQFGYYQLRIPGTDVVSNTARYWVDASGQEFLELKSKVEGICRAAKAMGGTATSFAGRIRKEVPCP